MFILILFVFGILFVLRLFTRMIFGPFSFRMFPFGGYRMRGFYGPMYRGYPHHHCCHHHHPMGRGRRW